MSDKINHPKHYTAGNIEVYDFIEAWNLDFACGNVIKYVARAPYKGTHLEDLKKAKWYLEKAIERQEARIAQDVADVLSGEKAPMDTMSYNEAKMQFALQQKALEIKAEREKEAYFLMKQEVERMKEENNHIKGPVLLG